MLKTQPDKTTAVFRRRTAYACIGAAGAVLAIDYLTGKHIEFPIVYALPVAMAAWNARKNMAYVLSLILPLARLGFHIPWGAASSGPVLLINTLVTSLALLLYAYLVDRTAWQTRSLKKRISALEGILPVCASCKRIRDERGVYHHMEDYFLEHSDVSFTHGLCPECEKDLYSDYFNKKLT